MSEDQLRELIRQEIARHESQRRGRWTLLARAWRQSILMLLAAVEEYEELPRSVPPRRQEESKTVRQ